MEFLNEDIPKCSHCSHYVVTKFEVSDYAKTLIYQGYTTTVVTNTYILYIKYINIQGKGWEDWKNILDVFSKSLKLVTTVKNDYKHCHINVYKTFLSDYVVTTLKINLDLIGFWSGH